MEARVATNRVERVFIVGGECSGKTTLSRGLAERLHAIWVPEYARGWVERTGREVSAKDVDAIVNGQRAAGLQAVAEAQRTGSIVIGDTCLVQSLVYSLHYFAFVPNGLEEKAREELDGAVVFVADGEIPWVSELKQRGVPASRARVQEELVRQLSAFGKSYTLLRGDLATRLDAAEKLLHPLLSLPRKLSE
jgi:HTH-type transcriptional regulator, transcriptional repressor of NAD biosynthesis genes